MNLFSIKILICLSFSIVVLDAMKIENELAPCICSRMLKPVCGSNGQTYANECMFQCLTRQHEKLTKNEKLRIEANRSCESL